MRQIRRRTSITLTVLIGSLLALNVTGCAIATPDPEKTTEEAPVVEYGDLSEALSTAVPRIVGVEDLGRSGNGAGYRLDATLVLDSAEPFTGDELDAAAEAIWRTLPWEPNAIALVAGVDGADGDGPEAVDLRAAAADLSPMGHTDVGQGGVSLFDMDERYGEWTAPE